MNGRLLLLIIIIGVVVGALTIYYFSEPVIKIVFPKRRYETLEEFVRERDIP